MMSKGKGDLKKKVLILCLILLLLGGLWRFFTYKLLEVPPGITSDEAAFGYNGALLSKTYHDENDRFMPFFVLSLDGRDWRQPVTQYSTMIAFKIFGSSYYNLRAVSVFFVVVSVILIFVLLLKMSGLLAAILGSIFFLSAPIVMIQAHMGLDNVAPVPFVVLWLLGVYLYQKEQKLKYLVLSGVALGLGFYTYKAMRMIAPTWAALTVGYLGLSILFSNQGNLEKKRQIIKSVATFSLAIFPFFAAIPFLQAKYPGAVFDRQSAKFDGYENFFYGFLANLDLSFLFISGDSTPFHSVGRYGALLLSTLPFFLIGIYQAVRKGGFWLLILAAFFSAPLFFGLVNSVYRASRLMSMLPSYALIASLGAATLIAYKDRVKSVLARKIILGLTVFSLIIVGLNYYDFISYYWNIYPTYYKTTESFGSRSHLSYLTLSEEAKKRNLTPFIEYQVRWDDGVSAKFYEQAYFKSPLKIWRKDEELPPNSILLTYSESLPGMKLLPGKLPNYHILIPQE